MNRIERVLLVHGRTLDALGDEPAELTHDQPVLASCYAASAGDDGQLRAKLHASGATARADRRDVPYGRSAALDVFGHVHMGGSLRRPRAASIT